MCVGYFVSSDCAELTRSRVQCRAMFFHTVDDATSIWIKGREFTVARMLGDYYKEKAPEFEGGSLAIFRLAPQDYHRYHSVRARLCCLPLVLTPASRQPVDGVMGHQDYIAGQYYTGASRSANLQVLGADLSVSRLCAVNPMGQPTFLC